MRPESYISANGARTLSVFDVEVNEHLRIYNVMFREMPSGERRILAPNAFGKRSCTFSLALAQALTKQAQAEYSKMEAESLARRAA